jgi:CyaY protein
MDEQAYRRAADACLERVARWLDDLEEIDVMPGDGLVTLEFEDGTRFVLNRQAAAHQMWLAAGARAWHYAWSGAPGSTTATGTTCTAASPRWWATSSASGSSRRPERRAATDQATRRRRGWGCARLGPTARGAKAGPMIARISGSLIFQMWRSYRKWTKLRPKRRLSRAGTTWLMSA